MDVALRPEFERFLKEKVQSGEYASATEAIEAGIARLMVDPELPCLNEAELADIKESLEEIRRGEVVDWRDFSKRWRQETSHE